MGYNPQIFTRIPHPPLHLSPDQRRGSTISSGHVNKPLLIVQPPCWPWERYLRGGPITCPSGVAPNTRSPSEPAFLEEHVIANLARTFNGASPSIDADQRRARTAGQRTSSGAIDPRPCGPAAIRADRPRAFFPPTKPSKAPSLRQTGSPASRRQDAVRWARRNLCARASPGRFRLRRGPQPSIRRGAKAALSRGATSCNCATARCGSREDLHSHRRPRRTGQRLSACDSTATACQCRAAARAPHSL